MELNKIYNEDCLEGMKRMPDKSVDLTVSSPPYDNLKSYNGNNETWGETVWKAIIKELYRVTAEGGVVVWVVNDATIKGSETGTSFKQALRFKEVGFNLHDTMIWHKANAFNFGSNLCYRQEFEYMFVFTKDRVKTTNFICDVPAKTAGQVAKGARKHADGSRDEVPVFVVSEFRKRGNVWSMPTSNKSNGHPATFPEQLAEDHILSWSNKGDIVFDPFMGSGTTAIACINTNRNYIGFELDEEYCELSNNRIKEFISEKEVLTNK